MELPPLIVNRARHGNRQRKTGLPRLLFGKLDPLRAVERLIDADYDCDHLWDSDRRIVERAHEEGSL